MSSNKVRTIQSATAAAVLLACTFFSCRTVAAEEVTITDVAGREVGVDAPVERVILGEGRQIYLVAALDRENPIERVVGWRDDFVKNDPNSYAAYAKKFPDMDKLPTFGDVKEGTFDIEQAVALEPDVIIMNLEAKPATDDAGYEETLAKIGIPLVYIDFREKPMENTEASARIVGKLFGKEDEADALIRFRAEQIERVTDVIAKAKPKRPLVFVERAGGFSNDCCMSFGDENFGKMVGLAGGENMASSIIPGTFGTVNPEQIIAADPDQVIVTGANWQASAPGGAWVDVGPGSDVEKARGKLEKLMQRPAFTGTKAVRDGEVHAIWHQFYNSPYQFVAVQEIAKWLHPDLFEDLDPNQTFRELHERFLPVDYEPGYFASLTPGE